MTIKQELTKEYVGEIVELYEIDLNPVGHNIISRFTPHSETNVTWRGEIYVPFPININGMNRSIDGAPSRPTLEASTASTLLTSMMISYGDLVGAKVTKWRTLSMYLDGSPDANPNQHWPVENYIIIQRSYLGTEGIKWVLANNIDKPGNILPRRQCLKDHISKQGLYCPGMQRFRAM